ncbi:hypothetical protein C8A01DRAFT_15212 [Parachaetomium inaequale]|uniref:Uncharacterized protein n=1 Tax=Parachaetomium inaequale TaxID=2588326 RepID=A0AAN6SSY9_9PEZI|nr:hypothetical protein C8A01DRAFT_15212 [Parachaetomium inaequale]
MRPDLLPPLVIPKRRTRAPILVASHPQQPTEQPVSQYRPSYQSLPPKPLPKPPAEHKLDDFDDIDVFNFYNPCLLPPSPIVPFPARAHTDPTLSSAPPPPYSRDPPPGVAPGLRRSTYSLSRRDRDYRRRSNYVALLPPSRSRSPSPPRGSSETPPSPFSIQRSPSPLYARPPPQISLPHWDTCGRSSFEVSRPPSPAVAPHPQPVASLPVPQWDASSSIYSVYTGEVPTMHANDDGADSWGQEDEEYTTPYLAMRPDSRGTQQQQQGYQEREQDALRELWGVIDGLLGPGKRLGDYDAKSIASMDSLANLKAAGGWDGAVKRSSGDSDQTLYGEATWWRAFRQGLLLS